MTTNLVNFDYTNNPFTVTFRPISRPVLSWREELAMAAKSIVNANSKPIYIAMSGGIDGEAVARVFMENDLPFTPITLRYANGENDHDTQYALDFCQKHGLPHRIIDISFNELYGPVMNRWINQGYHAANIYRYLQLHILETVENLGGTAILAAGEQVYYKKDEVLHIGISPELLLSFEYCRRNNTRHYVNFFLHTPEMYAAYMQIKLIDTLIANPRLCSNTIEAGYGFAEPRNTSEEKKVIYYREWPDMVRRKKYSGFENVRDTRHTIQQKLMADYPHIKSYYLPVPTIKQQLGI